MGYSDSRLRQAILYVAWLTRDDERFGSTKLNKALCRADFHSFFHHGRSVTNARYQALEDGPTVVPLLPTLATMQEAGEVRSVRAPGEAKETRQIPLYPERPETPLLDAQDIAELDAAVQRVQGWTAKEASDESHNFPGWKHAWAQGNKTIIPLESVFWARQDVPTDAQEALARELAAEYGLLR
ncbi:MAG: hypothetical protein QOH12_1301 [Solirubrobacteraceae bacterium]|jgi:hypothetical protein|nr:hypothetical protein [Solirubrobacteraceae bacterium]